MDTSLIGFQQSLSRRDPLFVNRTNNAFKDLFDQCSNAGQRTTYEQRLNGKQSKKAKKTKKISKLQKRSNRFARNDETYDEEPTRDNFDSFASSTFHDLNQSMCNMGKVGYTSLIDDAESCVVRSHHLSFQSTRDDDALLLDRTHMG